MCVYRHFYPSKRDITATRADASRDPDLLRFIDGYSDGGSFYDWGDDPSFFAAERTSGNAASAAWGVCRPDVRAKLTEGDVVVFFCAKRVAVRGGPTNYYFIGVGSVLDAIADRSRIWKERKFADYRRHYNLLVKQETGALGHYETFHPFHSDDWPHRLASPYVLFDSSLSRFNLRNPTHVSESKDGGKDKWRSASDVRVKRIEQALFRDFGIERRLRTSPTGNAHRHMNLTRDLASRGMTPDQLRRTLMPLV